VFLVFKKYQERYCGAPSTNHWPVYLVLHDHIINLMIQYEYPQNTKKGAQNITQNIMMMMIFQQKSGFFLICRRFCAFVGQTAALSFVYEYKSF
jgi:hypothetical protein